MMDLIHRVFLVAILWGYVRCQIVEEENIRILKNLFDRQGEMMQMLLGQQRKLETLEESQRNIHGEVRDLQSKLAVLEDLEEIRGAVQECSSKDQVSDFKSILITDECQDGTHKCSDNAICTDKVIHYTCTCLPGFSGDGYSCQDVNECEEGGHKCHPKAVCENSMGTHHCTCPTPYKGDGYTCDIDECEQGTHKCHPNATCTNNVDSYECSCLPPFIGDGTTCDPCEWPSIHLPDVGCVVPRPDCQWPSINLPGLGCITPILDYMSWYEAKELCEESGKRLIEEIDANHIKLLSELYLPRMKDNKQPWIGAKHAKWLTSQKKIADNLWKDGEPDGGEEICNYLNLGNTVPVGVGDAKCSANGRALCQFLY